MTEWIDVITTFYSDCFTKILDKITIVTSGGLAVSLGSFIIAALVVGMVISVFWKGAKT